MSSSDATFLLIVIIFFLGSGSAVLALHCFDATKQVTERTKLRRFGRDILGKVNTTQRARGVSTVTYTFSVEGAIYLGEGQMPSYHNIVIHKSDPILIRYLPSDPNLNHPAAWEWSPGSDFMLDLFVLFFATVRMR